MITTNELPATSHKGRLITLWTLSGLVALAFVGAGGAKLAGAPAMVEMFGKVGLGQSFRYFTGLLNCELDRKNCRTIAQSDSSGRNRLAVT